MAELGIFHPEERVELIAGQIVNMSAKGTVHTTTVRRIANVLRDKLQAQVDVHTQDPVQLNDFSEPEPDIAVVKVDPRDYVDHHLYSLRSLFDH
ncbi:Uma2 family endonuclease [Brasilonema sp. UFV-L1]|nr:Uma2 family endonuclease [Brasilonema sp. UFV-L1]